MGPAAATIQKVESLLAGLSHSELAELCVVALRRWRAKNPEGMYFTMHSGLGLELAFVLGERKKVNQEPGFDPNALKEVFLSEQDRPSLLGVVEFVWWMVRAGFAIPCAPSPDAGSYPVSYRLTDAGFAFLDAKEGEHPLQPGWPDRVLRRCPDLPEGVIALLLDARACMDNSLLRPAIVLMGVAYEVAIEHVADHLVTKRYLDKKVLQGQAAPRLEKVKDVIDQVVTNSDDKRTAHAAYEFAEQLRRRRNDGAHTRPRYGFEDRQEVEEFIVSAARHLPGLWSLAAC